MLGPWAAAVLSISPSSGLGQPLGVSQGPHVPVAPRLPFTEEPSVCCLCATPCPPEPSSWARCPPDRVAWPGVTGPVALPTQVFQFAVKESLILKLPTDELMNPSQKKKRKHRWSWVARRPGQCALGAACPLGPASLPGLGEPLPLPRASFSAMGLGPALPTPPDALDHEVAFRFSM